jgi:hypothetical protein
MRLLKPFVAFAAGAAVLLGFAAPAFGAVTSWPTNISGTTPGHVQFPYSEAAVAFRPRTAGEQALTVENYWIHDLTNQKGLDIRATRLDSGAPAWAYQTITVRNSRFTDINRREDLPGGAGLHIDHIRIAGGGNSQTTKTNILIENVTIDGGDALPILITDGVYGTVTLRNVKIVNTTLNNVQFKTDNVGSVDKIVIDNSPGIGVALIGRPGSIGEVLVRNSDDVRIGDSLNAKGRSGATISYIDSATGSSDDYPVAASPVKVKPAIVGGAQVGSVVMPPVASPVPEPGTLGLAAAAAAMLLARRRR